MKKMRREVNQNKGFSLVEIMVAMVIGLLTTLVIMQVFMVFEGRKRTATGTADAQTNGSVALYMIGRDLQMAGFGLLPTTNTPLKCDPAPTIDHDNDPGTPNIELNISPVIITDGGAAAGASDSITISYGSNPMGGIPTLISAMVGNTATVANNLGCRVGDIALATNNGVCAASRVSGPTDIAIPPVASVPANTDHITLENAAGISGGFNLACLGTWTRITYSVSNGNLLSNGTPTIPGIVNLQAQYGISLSTSDNRVEQWVNASSPPWNAPTVTQRNLIKAVRLAVVARNGLLENDTVSSACSSSSEASPTGLCAWAGNATSPAPTINLSNDPDWQRYRYRVFETIIPLRNVIWSKDQLKT